MIFEFYSYILCNVSSWFPCQDDQVNAMEMLVQLVFRGYLHSAHVADVLGLNIKDCKRESKHFVPSCSFQAVHSWRVPGTVSSRTWRGSHQSASWKEPNMHRGNFERKRRIEGKIKELRLSLTTDDGSVILATLLRYSLIGENGK
ncbi:unnamed protein product [Victoria cruziana]